MRAQIAASLILISALSAQADPPSEIPLTEIHEIALLDGSRVGTMLTRIQPGEEKTRRATTTLSLTLRRYGSTVRLEREEASIESATGRLLGVSMRQGQAGGKQTLIVGVADGDTLNAKVNGAERKVRWFDDVLSISQQQEQFATKKPKTGDKWSFRRYEPTYNAALTVRVEVKGLEKIRAADGERELLRVEMRPEKLEGRGRAVQPPTVVWWLDGQFLPQRKQTDLEGLGQLVLLRTTAAKAKSGTVAPLDVGEKSLITLNRSIPRPYDTRSVTYRVSVREEEKPSSVLPSDSHQQVRKAQGDSFELQVRPAGPGKGDEPPPEAEMTAANYYIDCQEDVIKDLARKAVGEERDDWKKAVRIESRVKLLLRNDNAAELAPASRIARTLRGDCRHHAFLTTALCRASGVPARTAIGLLYVYRGGPRLGFHMWTEVYIAGKWRGLDSTLGKAGVSATHIKVCDHSWAGTESLVPLLPVTRVLGKLRVEVLSVE